MDDKLLPCKCGGEAWVYSYGFHYGTGGYSVICKKCHTELGQCYEETKYDSWYYGKYETEAEAVEAWNTLAEVMTMQIKAEGITMPIKEERRRIAAELRKIDDTNWTDVREELKALDRAIGTEYGMPHAIQTTWERLADLIEPEPERTCRNMADEYGDGLEFVCSECTRAISEYEYAPEIGEFCPSCGAKVVE